MAVRLIASVARSEGLGVLRELPLGIHARKSLGLQPSREEQARCVHGLRILHSPGAALHTLATFTRGLATFARGLTRLLGSLTTLLSAALTTGLILQALDLLDGGVQRSHASRGVEILRENGRGNNGTGERARVQAATVLVLVESSKLVALGQALASHRGHRVAIHGARNRLIATIHHTTHHVVAAHAHIVTALAHGNIVASLPHRNIVATLAHRHIITAALPTNIRVIATSSTRHVTSILPHEKKSLQ